MEFVMTGLREGFCSRHALTKGPDRKMGPFDDRCRRREVGPRAARIAVGVLTTRPQTLRQGWVASKFKMIRYGDDQQQKNGPAMGFSSVAQPVQ